MTSSSGRTKKLQNLKKPSCTQQYSVEIDRDVVMKQNQSTVNFTLGREQCALVGDSCGFKLEPEVQYKIMVRVETNETYADSEMFPFKLASETYVDIETLPLKVAKEKQLTMILIYVAVCCCLLLASGYLIHLIVRRIDERKTFRKHRTPKLNFSEDIATCEFKKFFALMTDNSNEKIEKEFEDIQKFSSLLPYIPKAGFEGSDRYRDIIPFDHNRVILDGDIENSYINASYINVS